MHPVDIAVIIAESLPEQQAADWMLWWGPQQPPEALKHRSLVWWINRHARLVSAILYHSNRA